MTKTPENVPKALDAIADVVLAYRPKQSKTKLAKKRKKISSIGKPKNKSKNWGPNNQSH
jgi:hypothetical protein